MTPQDYEQAIHGLQAVIDKEQQALTKYAQEANNRIQAIKIQIEKYEESIRDIRKTYSTKDILGPWVYSEEYEYLEDDRDVAFLIFQDALNIEIHHDHYYLVVENHDWVSEDLCFLMEILAEYAVEIGMTPYCEMF